MTANEIQKYSKLSIPKLIEKVKDVFHPFIRKRDEGQPCISCGKYHVLQAGHFYSAGEYPALRFLEDNVNGQCKHCNYFKSGNLIPYRLNLIKKIGVERVEHLDFLASQYKKNHFKWDRFTLIENLLKYKNLKV